MMVQVLEEQHKYLINPHQPHILKPKSFKISFLLAYYILMFLDYYRDQDGVSMEAESIKDGKVSSIQHLESHFNFFTIYTGQRILP